MSNATCGKRQKIAAGFSRTRAAFGICSRDASPSAAAATAAADGDPAGHQRGETRMDRGRFATAIGLLLLSGWVVGLGDEPPKKPTRPAAEGNDDEPSAEEA